MRQLRCFWVDVNCCLAEEYCGDLRSPSAPQGRNIASPGGSCQKLPKGQFLTEEECGR